MKKIIKIGGIILQDKKILVVRKRTSDNRTEYIIPGGKTENNETDLETLSRELKEELKIELISAIFFGSFDEIAIFENVPINIKVYLTNIKGTPYPANEIKEYIWINKHYEKKGIKLGSVLSKFVIPELIKQDLL